MRGTIAQRTQWIKTINSIPPYVRLHILRLVENNYRVSSLNKVEWPAVVTLPIHHILCLGKAINGNHHNLQGIVRGKLTRLTRLLTVPNVVIHLWLVVEIGEVLPGNRQILQHTLTDRHTRHHDDKFLPVVALMQFMNRPQVYIRFTRTGLHLDGEVHAVLQRFFTGFQWKIRRKTKATFFRLAFLDVIFLLNFMRILNYLRHI